MHSESLIFAFWAPELQALLGLLSLLIYFIYFESQIYNEKLTLIRPIVNSTQTGVGPRLIGKHHLIWCIVWCLLAAFTFYSKPFDILYASGLFLSNQLNQFLDVFLFLYAALCLLLSSNWLKYASINCIEYGIFITLILLGQHFILMSTDLMSFYLSLEIQSFSFVILCSLNTKSLYSVEAGMKYFLLSAFSSCFLLLGICFIYSTAGVTQCNNIADLLNQSTCLQENLLFKTGVWLVSLTLLWKLAAAPFHLWAADVYAGVWSSVTLLISTLPKWAIFGFWVQQWHVIFSFCYPSLLMGFSGLCLILGALGALGQVNMKRLLAYSSVANIGFLLMPLCGTNQSYAALWTHMIIYFVTSLTIWGLLMSPFYRSSRLSTPQWTWDFGVVFQTQPMLASALVIAMISLAGLPPIAGFLGKWMIFWSAVNSSQYVILAFALLSTLISSIYYLRLIRIAYVDKPLNWSYFGEINSWSAYILCLSLAFLCVTLFYSSPLVLMTQYLSLLV
uniref:NADH dehydrogenase subunit 2 n=1 Tax=Jenufa perforata TaxID=993091 RepID=A0A6G7IU11_9CHLO|nr:NADH dehydrogenase subunit 2 [Jenufa perforata]QII41621.1 NADH dehydrogenase subunit 2 [Jenufa perforata]